MEAAHLGRAWSLCEQHPSESWSGMPWEFALACSRGSPDSIPSNKFSHKLYGSLVDMSVCLVLETENCQCSDYSERLNPLVLPAVLDLLKSPGLCHVVDEIIIIIENRSGRDPKKILNSKQK